MVALQEFAAGTWDIDNAGYHADRTAVSHSVLEVFRESVRLYHGQHVTGKIERKPATPAMQLGSALHAWLLERPQFKDLVAVIPEGISRRSNAGKEAYAAFEAAAAGKIVITQEQYDLLGPMADGVCANPVASRLLEADGKNELAVRWQDPRTGVWCKAKFDRLLDCGIALDIKTSSDPRPGDWARSAANFGYHRQRALYGDGREAALGIADEPFLHIVVGTAEPFDCIVCELDRESLELGQQQNLETLRQLKNCRDKEVWDGHWCNDVNKITLPKWAFYS